MTTPEPEPRTLTVDQTAVEAALREYLARLDYDLHKGIECDEESGEDTYPEEAADFFGHLAGAAPGPAASGVQPDTRPEPDTERRERYAAEIASVTFGRADDDAVVCAADAAMGVADEEQRERVSYAADLEQRIINMGGHQAAAVELAAESAHPDKVVFIAEYWEDDRWMYLGTSTDRDAAETRADRLKARGHGMPVRLVRATTTYVVETGRPEDGAQQPEGRLLACGRCYEENGAETHPHPECPYTAAGLPTPSGCRYCGDEPGHHGAQWVASVGLHTWEQPTQEQVKARMLARRANRSDAPSVSAEQPEGGVHK